MMIFGSILLSLFFLFGASLLSGFAIALKQIGRIHLEERWEERSTIFFFEKIIGYFFPAKKWECLLFSLHFSKNLYLFCYALSSFIFLSVKHVDWLFSETLIALLLFLVGDLLASMLAKRKPKFYFNLFALVSSLFLLVCTPLTLLFFYLLKLIAPRATLDKSIRMRDKILEIFQESELSPYFDAEDQNLILSVASFKERIAREVMVPRINVFSLSSDTSVQEAAESFIKEGYSRIPLYRDSVDNVIGVLLYKDILNFYAVPEKNPNLDMTVENLAKPILYTPETKKISHLLQEFRSKQTHLAIVVDEYGGTEGIVTIEDILEELVGDIADEYDIDEELLYTPLPGGGWIVDARMSILGLEEELAVSIPLNPEYDTIGGFIFHRAGAIPLKGWRIHLDEYDFEVLSSSERAIDKIRITPHSPDTL